MDQARKNDIKINIKGLANDLQIPIIPTVAREGKGLEDLKKVVSEIANNKFKINPFTINYSSEIETTITEVVAKLKEELGQFAEQINFRWLALRLLEGDESIIESVQQFYRINEKKPRNSEVKVDASF
jgi:Fe2+ transport system protein B